VKANTKAEQSEMSEEQWWISGSKYQEKHFPCLHCYVKPFSSFASV